ncbi:hypothetical protein A5893_04525 [Pedobacter psychrophilus]|uniref:Uncharacterized protein n=1 Tax=Pedobacter psychrophilus TaxID=1826909 RepID=A0A179DPA9_9SPHI|nr:hypothetical protein [Pedobacter psychrophilus]OAQ42379.1 hypothetical protein A5893_04525 [Pedobacter psychrophilus]
MKLILIKYLLLSSLGVLWYYFALITTELFGIRILTTRLWSLGVLFAIITSVSVGITFYKAILKSKGTSWYLLPFLTIFFASLMFGSLYTAFIDRPYNSWSWILAFVFYSLTYFIWLFYPLALLTQYLIRFTMANFSDD